MCMVLFILKTYRELCKYENRPVSPTVALVSAVGVFSLKKIKSHEIIEIP